MMSTITVRRGLRRLEFLPTPNSEGHTVTHVIVEFTNDVPLREGQIIRIDLGIREGVERTLEGVPKLVRSGKSSTDETFLYRLEGDVA